VFTQSSGAGRILNAIWMVARWSILSLNPKIRPDVLIVGTDPILSVLVAIVWRRFKPRTKIVHWCFDLYPEAAIAAGIVKANSRMVALLSALLRNSYAACDLIVDIGSCMRRRLERYGIHTPMETMVPWALDEPSQAVAINASERSMIFGETKLALMYSGSLGKAHSFEDILQLARILRQHEVNMAFSVNRNGEDALREAIRADDVNIAVVPRVSADQISTRLSAADIHIVSLKEAWTGTVVPSKFFGALAIGRPVLFCGSPESAIARWITEFKVGWVLAPGTANQTATELKRLLSHREEVESMFQHCHQVYNQHFSKAVTTDSWDQCLQKLLEPRIPHC
jgi:colanic acid biosynthesis glycosyl transferase WcaI